MSAEFNLVKKISNCDEVLCEAELCLGYKNDLIYMASPGGDIRLTEKGIKLLYGRGYTGLDMDHFGNPEVTQGEGEAFDALLHKQIDKLPPVVSPEIPRVGTITGSIEYVTEAELKERTGPHLGLTFEEKVELNQTFGKLGEASPEFCGTLTAPAKASVLDTQVGGGHYKKLGQYQPWQVAAACMTPAELRGYMKGTVLAYLMREGDKGGDLDIEKALHTMQLWQEVRKDKPDAK